MGLSQKSGGTRLFGKVLFYRKEQYMNNMITTHDVKHKYTSGLGKTIQALDKVSIHVEKGEFIAILGHNGSGKSTLAKHLNALLLPDEGVVFVNSMDTKEEKNIWAIRQAAGMVFQNPDNQIVATIVEEDVAFGVENIGIDPKVIRQRVDQALEIVDMTAYMTHSPHLLSGGQKQRIAIAGIIAMRPDCIILDEPTAMLDPVGRKEVIDTIRRLNKEEEITIILITHYMEETVLADRIYVMDNGKVEMEGNPKQIFMQVDKLKEIGLDVPQITEIAYELNKKGIKIPNDILTIDEMVVELCQLK